MRLPQVTQALNFKPEGHTATMLCVDPSEENYRVWVDAAAAVTPSLQIKYSSSCADAEEKIKTSSFVHFAIAENLPDGDGLDFFSNVKMTEPAAKAFFVGHTGLNEREREDLGVLVVIAPPLHRVLAEGLLMRFFEKSRQRPGFVGSLRVISVVDLVQLRCLQAKKATLRIRKSDDQCTIYFNEKGICHCSTGKLKGVEAFNEVVGWTEGEFQELAQTDPPEVTITQPWNNLLMEAVRLRDEAIQYGGGK
jgi:hypothetical protein